MMKQFEIWLADLSPRMGTEPGKTRPVLIVQTNLLNDVSHPSTLVCPITSNVQPASTVLRVGLKKGHSGLEKDSDVMMDQVRSIDNRRLIKRLGAISPETAKRVQKNLHIVFGLQP